jgi:hypothetical protein
MDDAVPLLEILEVAAARVRFVVAVAALAGGGVAAGRAWAVDPGMFLPVLDMYSFQTECTSSSWWREASGACETMQARMAKHKERQKTLRFDNQGLDDRQCAHM